MHYFHYFDTHLIVFCLFFLKRVFSYQITYLGADETCHPLGRRTLSLDDYNKSSLIVRQTHKYDWPLECRFRVKTKKKALKLKPDGIVAVINNLSFRRNSTTGKCIDYVKFRSENDETDEICGIIKDSVLLDNCQKNEFFNQGDIQPRGEIEAIIHIDRRQVEYNDMYDPGLEIVFTSFKDCQKEEHKHYRSCNAQYNSICIYEGFFNDSHVNCPYSECSDENFGCQKMRKMCVNFQMTRGANNQVALMVVRHGLGNLVVYVALISLVIGFVGFFVFLWTCRKLGVCVWADSFARPSSAARDRQDPERTVTLATSDPSRFAMSESINLTTQPWSTTSGSSAMGNAPPYQQDKDLPPSYESLFPSR